MKEYIKKIGIEILVLIIGISNLSINTYASEGFKNTNELLVRSPYGYYEKEIGLGDGYFNFIAKNKYIPLKLATI